LEVSGAVRQI